MDLSQHFLDQKGKTKGKRNLIKTPEDFGKIFSFQGAKPDPSLEAGHRENAKKLQPCKAAAASQLELKPAQLSVLLANTDESDDYDVDAPGQVSKRTLGFMQRLLGSQESTRTEAGDGIHPVTGGKTSSVSMGRGEYYSAFKKPRATYKHLQSSTTSSAKQQMRGGLSRELYLALHMEENNKLKAAVVQTLTEMERQQLQWQEKEADLWQAHSELQNMLTEKEAALEDAMDRLYNLEEQLVQVTIDKDEAVAQAQAQIHGWRDLETYLTMQTEENKALKEALVQAQLEIQSWRELEVYVAMQTEENYRLGAALVQAQREIGHQQQWQEKIHKLHSSNSNLSATLMQREKALEGVMNQLHDSKEQLVKITAEREALAAEVEQLNKRLKRAKPLHNEVSHLNSIRNLNIQHQTKEAEVGTLGKSDISENGLQRQWGSPEILEAGRAMQMEENNKPRAQLEIQSQSTDACPVEQSDEKNKVETAVVQTKLEVERLFLENPLELNQSKKDALSSVTEMEIPLEGVMEKPHEPREQPTKNRNRPPKYSLWSKFFGIFK